MKKYMLFISLFCILSTSLPASGEKNTDKKIYKDAANVNFPVLKGYKLKMEVISPEREFYAEENVKITFRVTNTDSKKIMVYEWMLEEGDNMVIYYKPYDGKPTDPKEPEWKCLRPKLAEKPRRIPLTLNPGNAVLIDKEFALAGDITQAELAKGGKKFYVAGALNLKSLDLKCQPFEIKIK